MHRMLPLALAAAALLLTSMAPATAQLLAFTDHSVVLQPSYDRDLLVRVHNDGPAEATGTAVVGLPEDLEATRLPAGCTADGHTLTCRTGSTLPSTTTTFPIEVAQHRRGPHQITATVTSSVRDLHPVNDVASLRLEKLATPRAGSDPTSTAVNVSTLRFGEGRAEWVVLARRDGFADALAGSSLTDRGPLLLTASDQLPDRVRREVRRVLGGPGRVYLLGGPDAIAPGVAAQLADEGHDVRRLAGPTRVHTALAIATERVRLGAGEDVFVARAEGDGSAAWADSIAVGGIAAATGRPVLLTPRDHLPADVARWITDRNPGQAIVVGGTAAVSTEVEDRLPTSRRIAGTDRAATAVALADELPPSPLAMRGYHLVNGYDADGWAYGLAAAGLVADVGAPILYTDTDHAPEATSAALTACQDDPVFLAPVGGPSQIDPELRASLDELDKYPC